MRTTYTYAVLEVSKQCYDEIFDKLKLAGYDHAFGTHNDNGKRTEVIDMHGIGLCALKEESTLPEHIALGLTPRIIACVKKYPGRTAWGIAKELDVSSASVSSILRRLAEAKKLRRAKGARGSWIYYDPRFGHDY